MDISFSLFPVTHSDWFSGGASDFTPLPSGPWQVWHTDVKRASPFGNSFFSSSGSRFACALLTVVMMRWSCLEKVVLSDGSNGETSLMNISSLSCKLLITASATYLLLGYLVASRTSRVLAAGWSKVS